MQFFKSPDTKFYNSYFPYFTLDAKYSLIFLRKSRLIVTTKPVRFRCLRDAQSANSQSWVRGWLLGWKTIRTATEYYPLSLYRAARRHLRRKARRSPANLSPRYPPLFSLPKNTSTLGANEWILPPFCAFISQQTIGRKNLLSIWCLPCLAKSAIVID